MSYMERQIANELREMYPELSVFESLQIAVGVRQNQLIKDGLGVSDLPKTPTSLQEIVKMLDEVGNAIDLQKD